MLALAAACASPARERASELMRTPGTGEPRRCLFVSNGSEEQVELFADGERLGVLAPRSSGEFFTGRSAGPTTALLARSAKGEWRATIEGPPWECHWLLRAPDQ